ncbi:MAG TPA: phage tail sheath C-terminal domain-containing protein [Bacteroidales bacterium]
MATYKTPDVYVKEISIFPPSVAEVETAVPAFIGYTGMAKKVKDGDLYMKAEKVKSIVEFEEKYGGGPPLEGIQVALDDTNNASEVTLSQKFYLYDSLRMFFNNGGGKCYIISVGNYTDTITYGTATTHMLGGLNVLKKEDEPTMIVFPDAVRLSGDGLYNLQQQALQQCGDLMDRVTICDLMNTGDLDADVETFRSKIGINNLKYGAAYTPWLKTQLPKSVHYRNITLKRGSGSTVLLENLTSDAATKALIADLRTAISESNNVKSSIIEAVAGAGKTLKQTFDAAIDTYDSTITTASTLATIRTELRKIYSLINGIGETLFAFRSGLTASSLIKQADVDNIVTNYNLKNDFQTLVNNSFAFGATRIFTDGSTTSYVTPASATPFTDVITALVVTDTGDGGPIDAAYAAAASDYDRGTLARNAAKDAFASFNAAIANLVATATKNELTKEESLGQAFGLYKSILTKINETLSELPPSGAIAGIYSYVDNTRGVWKAPANVSLSGVSGLTEKIDFEDQKDLNVDVNAGKSINAIRSFTGKGVLVWGARTLAGNDNEWRYVPVRRFFNMAEESIKKSTYWAVFEPNDANTWVKVKAMIENYLTNKWRDGALAGSKPDEAFFVKVGLGLTMTPLDILEGRMNVEIGMAVVRPAEFIILKFSHKMQES